MMQDDKDKAGTARVEIDTRTLARLLGNRQMGVADLKCLDAESKRLVWRICLNNCLKGRC